MIRGRRRTTVWNLFFHYASIVLALISGIVLVPVYLRHIPLDLYGVWLATGNILAWLTLIDPGLSSVLQQQVGVAYGRGDNDELNALLTGGILLSAAISVVLLAAGIIASHNLNRWLNVTGALDTGVIEQAFALAVVGTALMVFSYGITAFNIGLQSSLGIGLVYVVAMVSSLVLTVILLYQGLGLLALPVGMIARGAGLTVGNVGYLLWRYSHEGMSLGISLRGMKGLAKLSSYTFFGRGMSVVATNLDAFLLTRYVGAEHVPVYVLTCKGPSLSRMILERPSAAFIPAVTNLIGTGEIDKARVVLLRLLRLLFWLIGLIAGGFFLLNDDFVALWVGPALYAGQAINVVIILSLVFAATITSLSNLCFSMGNIRGNSICTLAQGVIAIPVMLFGAWRWGMLGVAAAPLVAMLAVSAWYYPIAFSRMLKLGKSDLWAMGQEVAAVSVATATTIGCLFWIAVTTWPKFISAAAAVSVVYLIVLSACSAEFRVEATTALRSAMAKVM